MDGSPAVLDSSVWWSNECKCQRWSKQREEEKGQCRQTHTTAEEKSYLVIPSIEKFNKFTPSVKTYCRTNYPWNVAAQGNKCNHKIVNKIEWKYKINAMWETNTEILLVPVNYRVLSVFHKQSREKTFCVLPKNSCWLKMRRTQKTALYQGLGYDWSII